MNNFNKTSLPKSGNPGIAYRRFIYSIFIILFFAITPLVVLYTEGYRYNFQKGRVQKTGILIISSTPKKADIYLNGQKADDYSTPAKIEKVLPADYEIRLSKEGYHDWQKRLTVNENQTTFAEKIILWKMNWPVSVSLKKAESLLTSPDKSRAIYIDSNKAVQLFDFNDGKFYQIDDLKEYQNVKIVSWSASSRKFLIKGEKNANTSYFVYTYNNYDLNTGAEKFTLPGKGIISVKWDKNSDNKLFTEDGSSLWSIDLMSKKPTLIGKIKNWRDFIPVDNIIYYLSENYLYKQSADLKKEAEKIAEINCPNCLIAGYKSNYLILLNKENQSANLIDLSGQKKILSLNAKGFDWLNDQTLLYYNDWEIYVYHLGLENSDLITRPGQKINSAVWHPEGKHIFFATEDKIRVIELDNRELRNTVEMSSGIISDYLNFDQKGRNLFFSGEGENALPGIYKLNVQ